jgi:hypothetical protein
MRSKVSDAVEVVMRRNIDVGEQPHVTFFIANHLKAKVRLTRRFLKKEIINHQLEVKTNK